LAVHTKMINTKAGPATSRYYLALERKQHTHRQTEMFNRLKQKGTTRTSTRQRTASAVHEYMNVPSFMHESGLNECSNAALRARLTGSYTLG
jgi:hypothetical protein